MPNKIVKLVSIILLACLCTGCVPEQNGKYPGLGRDGVDIFGDGRFVVLRGNSSTGGHVSYCLYDREPEILGQVEGELLQYETHDKYIYAVGLLGPNGKTVEFDAKEYTLEVMPEMLYYTKVNFENGQMEQSEELAIFDEEEQAIFEKMLEKKTLHE